MPYVGVDGQVYSSVRAAEELGGGNASYISPRDAAEMQAAGKPPADPNFTLKTADSVGRKAKVLDPANFAEQESLADMQALSDAGLTFYKSGASLFKESGAQVVLPDGTISPIFRKGTDLQEREAALAWARDAAAQKGIKWGVQLDPIVDEVEEDPIKDMTLAKEAIERLIASADHYMATGEDDGGGFVNAATGLPAGAANEQEAFLMRTGNYKMNMSNVMDILERTDDAYKQAIIQNTNSENWQEAKTKASSEFLYGAIGSLGDSRSHVRMLATSLYDANAFVNAVSVANAQNYSRGVQQKDEDGNPIGYFDESPITFGVEKGQPVMYGAGNTLISGIYPARLNSVWVNPEDIQNIVSGDVYSNYQEYYDKFRSGYEFLNDIDFLDLKPFQPIVRQNPTQPVTGDAGPTDGTGTGTGTDTGTQTPATSLPNTTTLEVPPVTYQTQQPQPVVQQQPQPVVQPSTVVQPTLAGPQTGTYPQAPVTGTFNVPSQTAGLSAVPASVTVATDTAGLTPTQLTQTMPGSGGTPNVGVQNSTYRNRFNQQITVTEMNGQPITYVPPGYSKVGAAKGGYMTNGYAAGGQVQDTMLEAKFRIASMNGYNGPKTNQALDSFANASPAMKAKFNAIGAALAKGGYIRKGYAEGGATSIEDFQGMQQGLITQTMQPIQAPLALIQPTVEDFIPTTAGQAAPIAPFAEAATVPTTSQAGMPIMTPASVMQAATVTPQVQAVTAGTQAAQGTVAPQAQVQAAQQATTSVSDLQAAQGSAIMMNNPVQREIQAGELISGAANAEKAAAFTEQVQAATATPSQQATVQGQLEGLMQQFEGGKTPAWAAGAMRNASAMLAARGLGASSMAGQAVIQAAMEAALPIAQMDAQVQAQFEAQNLSNRQQRAMLAAQQRAEFLNMEFTQEFQARVQNSARIGDIANMNFTAEQSIALENSRAANTVNLQNLSNRQAMVMAEAAALSQLDMQNLNNRQQAAVQNAQNFLQMDMQNLSNQQQTALFNSQQNIQALFTDQAQQNAAAQFNASSENQTNQFFASLASQVSQFNAVQQNAMDQFNVNAVNSLRQYNSQIQQQRDMFNAQNGLVVAQANAQWRQNMATLNTAAQNQSNLDFAKTINALTSTNLDAIWQRERDLMSFAFTSSESAMDRSLKLILGDKQLEAIRMELDAQEDAARGALWTRFLFGSGGSSSTGLLGSII